MFTYSTNITYIFSYGTLPEVELCFRAWVNKILLITYDIKAFNTYTSPSIDTHKLNSCCGKLLRSFVLSFCSVFTASRVHVFHLVIKVFYNSIQYGHIPWAQAL